jgi:hypothetical protein
MRFEKATAMIALLVAVLTGTAGQGRADPPGSPYAGEQGTAKDRGVIKGDIASVDYGRGQLVVNSSRGKVSVTVLPTTGIFRGSNDYAALSDLTVGTRVEISVSEIGGRLIAQIIRIK